MRIIEVGPRDGLQNESLPLKTEEKVEFINRLIKAGAKSIEVTSFVRAHKVPQMGDANDLYLALDHSLKDISYPCLVPNEKGLESALKANVKEIAVFTSISESFNKKNINRTIKESLLNIKNIIKIAKLEKIKTRAYISTAFHCPYEGEMERDDLVCASLKLLELGAYEVSVGDTIGRANPRQVIAYIEKMKQNCDVNQLAMHFHDTEGRALSNILAALEMGVSSFDSSAGGLGGCPFAKGATGNVATEDVISLMHSMGIETGIKMDLLVEASLYILEKLGKRTTSKYLQSYLSKRK